MRARAPCTSCIIHLSRCIRIKYKSTPLRFSIRNAVAFIINIRFISANAAGKRPEHDIFRIKFPSDYLQVLLAQLTGQQEYQNAARAFCNFSARQQKRTPKGLLYIDKFGTLCHAANVAFVCLQAADYPDIGDPKEYREFAKQQIHYMLGGAGI